MSYLYLPQSSHQTHHHCCHLWYTAQHRERLQHHGDAELGYDNTELVNDNKDSGWHAGCKATLTDPYLMCPEVRQAVQHSMDNVGVIFPPQFVQQNRNQGRNLQAFYVSV